VPILSIALHELRGSAFAKVEPFSTQILELLEQFWYRSTADCFGYCFCAMLEVGYNACATLNRPSFVAAEARASAYIVSTLSPASLLSHFGSEFLLDSSPSDGVSNPRTPLTFCAVARQELHSQYAILL
jgi:hypothetical protein